MRTLDSTTFIAIDFESAGTAPGLTDEPVQIAWARMNGMEIDPASFFSSYLRVERPITWAARKVHGITSEHIADAPALTELWPRLKRSLHGHALIAHGSGTERRFLRAFPFHGFGPWIDTVSLARAAFPTLPDYSLGPLLEYLELVPELDSLCPGLHWHHALYDAVACLVFLRFLIRIPCLKSASLDSLIAPDPPRFHSDH
jgi:DNA polymerase-3 subunit epsilon